MAYPNTYKVNCRFSFSEMQAVYAAWPEELPENFSLAVRHIILCIAASKDNIKYVRVDDADAKQIEMYKKYLEEYPQDLEYDPRREEETYYENQYD